MDKLILRAAKIIKESGNTFAFTGAGISVESGIPPFRGENGLWNKFDQQVLEINYFLNHGEECWKFIKEIFYDFFDKAQPNMAHRALAQMEQSGYISAIVTQNVDNLHQLAGSQKVYEFHGNSSRLVCPECKAQYKANEFNMNNLPPRCLSDNQILKPDFVFFGEGIPTLVWEKSFACAELCKVCLVIGSTGEVVPASYIPRTAKDHGAFIIEINPAESSFTNSITDLHLKGNAGDVLSQIWLEIQNTK